jgi:hypothetical protein
MNHAARHALRHQQAPALLDKIREQILAMSRIVLPKSAAGKACSYALQLTNSSGCAAQIDSKIAGVENLMKSTLLVSCADVPAR